jgi:hypothetical protein
MTQPKRTHSLFTGTKVLAILLIGGGVCVMKYGGKALRKNVRQAEEIPRHIETHPHNSTDDSSFFRSRAVISTGKAAFNGSNKTHPKEKRNSDRALNQPLYPTESSSMAPSQTTASFQ